MPCIGIGHITMSPLINMVYGPPLSQKAIRPQHHFPVKTPDPHQLGSQGHLRAGTQQGQQSGGRSESQSHHRMKRAAQPDTTFTSCHKEIENWLESYIRIITKLHSVQGKGLIREELSLTLSEPFTAEDRGVSGTGPGMHRVLTLTLPGGPRPTGPQ